MYLIDFYTQSFSRVPGFPSRVPGFPSRVPGFPSRASGFATGAFKFNHFNFCSRTTFRLCPSGSYIVNFVHVF
jgi:hypothetical protein